MNYNMNCKKFKEKCFILKQTGMNEEHQNGKYWINSGVYDIKLFKAKFGHHIVEVYNTHKCTTTRMRA